MTIVRVVTSEYILRDIRAEAKIMYEIDMFFLTYDPRLKKELSTKDVKQHGITRLKHFCI